MFTAQSRLASPAWPAIFVADKKFCSAHLLKLQEKPLSYKNTTEICVECQGRQGGRVRSKKTDGRNGAELRPEVRSTLG
jgi:hypothetical protein